MEFESNCRWSPLNSGSKWCKAIDEGFPKLPTLLLASGRVAAGQFGCKAQSSNQGYRDIHILAESSDTWKFDYTLTITLDDGTTLPPYNSNINGISGIVLNQNNRDYSGICTEPSSAGLNIGNDPCDPRKLAFLSVVRRGEIALRALSSKAWRCHRSASCRRPELW